MRVQSSRSTHVLIGARIALGAVFTVAGVSKLQSLSFSSSALVRYLPIGDTGAYLAVLFVSLFEMVLGLGLVLTIHKESAHMSDHLALMLASAFLGIGLFRLLAGLDSGCGCFGQLSFLDSGFGQVVRDTGILLLASVPYLGRFSNKNTLGLWSSGAILTSMLATGGVAFSAGYFPPHYSLARYEEAGSWRYYSSETALQRKLVSTVFGESSSHQELSNPGIYRIVSEGSQREVGDGWVIERIAPIEGGLLRIVLVLDPGLKILRIRYDPTVGPVLKGKFTTSTVKMLESTLIRAQSDTHPFIPREFVQQQSAWLQPPMLLAADLTNELINEALLVGALEAFP